MILCLCPNPSVDTFVQLEDFKPGAVNRAQHERQFPGGKGVHVAMALAELGLDVTLLGFWGGPTGSWIIDACSERGIHCVGPRTRTWSRTCLTFQSEGCWGDTELLGTGPDVDDAQWCEFSGIFQQHIGAAELCVMSGSWPLGIDADACVELIEIARAADTPCYLDASGDVLRHGLDATPFGVHVSLAEAREIVGDLPAEACARAMAQRCTRAAVTAGEGGLYLAEGKILLHAVCRIDTVISAVGSGDCLLAGLCLAHAGGLSLDVAAQYGAACGAANCLRPELGMLFRKDVERLLPKTQVRKLA